MEQLPYSTLVPGEVAQCLLVTRIISREFAFPHDGRKVYTQKTGEFLFNWINVIVETFS